MDGWSFAQHTKDNLLRLTPNTEKGLRNWKVLVILEKHCENDLHVMKAALQNRDTDDFLTGVG